MKYGWRWFGPGDPVTIEDVMQVGATEVVSALHHLPNGVVWPVGEIMARRRQISWSDRLGRPSGLNWSVVESLPVHETIKIGRGDDLEVLFSNYRNSIKNLAECGIKLVIYNFMPVLDWTRTDLAFELPCGARALRYDAMDVAAFDLFILERERAGDEYAPETAAAAQLRYERWSEADRERVIKNIIAGLPGAEQGFTISQFRRALSSYRGIDSDGLKDNLRKFLRAVVPVAEECGVRLAIHPDDPPWPLFGLPRIAGCAADFADIMAMVESPCNCINLCAGSLGASAGNDLVAIYEQWAERIPFVHLRSVKREEDGSFYEDSHLAGDSGLCQLVAAIMTAEASGRIGREWEVTMRPDHGWQMLDDLNRHVNPGYSCIGRMRGLAEVKGLAVMARYLIGRTTGQSAV